MHDVIAGGHSLRCSALVWFLVFVQRGGAVEYVEDMAKRALFGMGITMEVMATWPRSACRTSISMLTPGRCQALGWWSSAPVLSNYVRFLLLENRVVSSLSLFLSNKS